MAILKRSESDREFLAEYLDQMRAPGPWKYSMNVTQTFRIEDPREYDKFIGRHILLMHGAHTTKVKQLLEKGFNPKNGFSPKKAFFGEGYYFTCCTTKAVNYASAPNSYTFEMKADKGQIQPNIGDVGYIVLCEVAIATPIERAYRQKTTEYSSSITTIADSIYVPRTILRIGMKGPHGVELPAGGLVPNVDSCAEDADPKTVLTLPEYVVSHPRQIRMRYLVEYQIVELTPKDVEKQKVAESNLAV